MELSELQTEILEAPYNKIVVLSSAASGKTRLMTEKARQLLQANCDPRSIAVITFTNMAATELRQRLGSDYKEGMFVGTIHALANYWLNLAGVKTDQVIEEEDFDKLFEMVEKHPICIRHLDWLLLDEAQDSDDLQFKFLFKLINPDHFFVCADVKQSIYQWKGSNPSLVLDLTEQAGVQTYDLNENYRNGSNILNYAKRLIRPNGMYDTSIAMSGFNGTVTEVGFVPSQLMGYIHDDPVYREWAILCRTNKEINEMGTILSNEGIPFDTFRQGDLSRDELVQKMQQNTVKLLTIHSAKGLEWDNVIVMGVRYAIGEERNICYVAATRARKHLIWVLSNKTVKKRQTKMYSW